MSPSKQTKIQRKNKNHPNKENQLKDRALIAQNAQVLRALTAADTHTVSVS